MQNIIKTNLAVLTFLLITGCGTSEPPLPSLNAQSSFDVLAIALQDGNPSEKAQAAELLAKHHEDKAKSLLSEALTMDDAAVRLHAVRFFALHEYEEARDPLLTRLDDPDLRVRQEAAITLGMMKSPQAESLLAETFTKTTDLDMSLRTAMALGMIATPAAGEALITRIDDPDMLLRMAILTSLGELDPLPLPPRVQACVADKEPPVRIQLAAILWRAKENPEATKLLIVLLDDKEENVRFAAANTLKVLKDPTSITKLQETASKDKSDRVRSAAKAAISAINDE